MLERLARSAYNGKPVPKVKYETETGGVKNNLFCGLEIVLLFIRNHIKVLCNEGSSNYWIRAVKNRDLYLMRLHEVNSDYIRLSYSVRAS